MKYDYCILFGKFFVIFIRLLQGKKNIDLVEKCDVIIFEKMERRVKQGEGTGMALNFYL